MDPETKEICICWKTWRTLLHRAFPRELQQQIVQMHLVHGIYAALQHHKMGDARAQHTGPSEPGTAQHKVMRRAGIAPA